MDLGFGTHVDAPRWLIKNEDLRLGAEPLCHDHFLLVATAQKSDKAHNGRGRNP